MKFYVNKVMYYGDKFIESPAGIALKATLDKSHKRHGALPPVNKETILKFQATDEELAAIRTVEDTVNLVKKRLCVEVA